ncbi:MAG: tRNA (guanosine(46)-N7)-methyltransferase TrmB [Spirochaetia bacterium]
MDNHIKSFVKRASRMSKGQQRGYEKVFPEYEIPYNTQGIDFLQEFGNTNPVIIEIGFGMGGPTLEIAKGFPETNFIGIEVHKPGIGKLASDIQEQNIKNLRIIEGDAVSVFQHMLPGNSLAGIHVFFPDPWPKKKHHKRRLLQPEFVSLAAERLINKTGYLYAATDWEDYAHHILKVFQAEPLLENTCAGFSERKPWRPETKFEKRGMNRSHPIFDIFFVKSE